ncbi:Hypothetical protein PHPALM_11271 [Phytophthora palmivora]|uniref:Uncharacterized protein n=1 Tax=Phytophthora palmivora TaxID=4796 RepID=A0A2P4Y2M6_9STRA|nr:Hypothetical protein PHPALM_11271 [Phytophthora palmivora]
MQRMKMDCNASLGRCKNAVTMPYTSEQYQANKTAILEAKKRYYQKNRERILARQKEYDDQHREEIKVRQKRYYNKRACKIALD